MREFSKILMFIPDMAPIFPKNFNFSFRWQNYTVKNKTELKVDNLWPAINYTIQVTSRLSTSRYSSPISETTLAIEGECMFIP